MIVIIGLLDVFLTVLNYDGFGFLSSRLYRITWTMTRRVTRLLPKRMRTGGRALGAPLMIPATLGLWMALQILGFALIYYANMPSFSFTGGTEPTILNAVYFSGVSITNLGFGDITPSIPLYGLVAFTQAAIDFSIITLFISYVLNICPVLLQWNTLSADLYDHVEDSAGPRNFLRAHFPDDEPWGLAATLGNLHEKLISYFEGLRRYPIVYYFYSRGIQRSIPYVFHMSGETAAALRWGCRRATPPPKSHSSPPF
ncbi:MAG: potassium channel family protein [Actinomycetota bacterium]|nr:potassium channel family protein [Actinomycetota bacterium]